MSTQPGTDPTLEQLLRSAASAARDGKRGAAHALFLALSREHADDPRVWLGVAGTTSDPAEQRTALERAVDLDPANERARRALERLGAPAPGTTDVLPETITGAAAMATPAPPPTPEPARAPDVMPAATLAEDQHSRAEQEQQRSPFPLLNVLAALVILLLLVAVGVVIGRNLLGTPRIGAVPTATLVIITPPAEAQPTPPLVAPTTPAQLAPTAPITGGGTPGAATTAPPATPATPQAPVGTPPALGTPPPALGTPPPALGTVPPAPTASVELPLGQMIDYDGWSATLLRPDYAVMLDGAIGDLQPAGRFVLAVVAVINNSPVPRVLPPDFFALIDSAGTSYKPVPGASTVYLALYERGQRGDLALEDVIDPGSGIRSVPILFDVPITASGLRLTMPGTAGAGWPVDGALPAPVGP